MTLSDQSARDTIVKAIDQTLFVEAGAGSGKTTSLVERIVSLVDDGGVPVGRIAAITFTEAAARELRIRVRDALLERGLSGGEVESAAFTTLHGFALRLLSDHPIEAGLPPGFGVADEVTSTLEFERDWRLFIGQVGDDMRLLEVQERAAALGIKLGSFSSVAKIFEDNWDLLGGDEEIGSEPTAAEPSVDSVERWHESRLPPSEMSELAFDDLLEEIQATTESLSGHCISEDDLLCQALRVLSDSIEPLMTMEPMDQLQSVLSINWPRRNAGKAGNWRTMKVADVREAIEQLRSGVDFRLEQYRHEVVRDIEALVAQHVSRRVHARQRSGLLAFHDLLVLARRLLRNDEAVRFGLHQRYSRILLDEFQDTDPIQIELAVLLASPEPVGKRPWTELAAELPAGRLVVVGDPKQAIYRFRRADISVYSQAEDVLVSQSTKLVSNFRSVPGIVDWVNEFFGRVIGDGSPGTQPSYTPLVAVRSEAPQDQSSSSDDSTGGTPDRPVTVLGRPYDSKEFNVGQIREAEAADVAAVICSIMEKEWLVERDDAWLPARLSDIAILIPSRLSLPSLESAMSDANIPFRPETSSLVYSTQEVRDLLAGVRAVVDPTSSIDVVAALRSSLFAIGDDELLEWKLAEASWDYRQEDCPAAVADSPLAAAFETLREWHADRWWIEPAALIDRIVRDRRLRELALADSRPRDRWRRHRFLAEQAREFTEIQGGDLADFVAWVEIQSSDVARITEPVPPEPDDDAVRILTIHGAKGLEFPIAILAGAPSQEGRARPGPQVIFSPDDRPEVKIGKQTRTLGFDARASVEEILDAHERIRLYYVAATRARDHLVVCAHHKDEKRLSIGKRTWEVVQAIPELWRPFVAPEIAPRFEVEPPTQLRLSGGGYREDLAEWQRSQAEIVSRAGANRYWSATAIAAKFGDEAIVHSGSGVAEPNLLSPDAIDAESVSGRGLGPAFGTAVHEVLERIDFDRPDSAEELSQRWATHVGIPDLAQEVAERVRHGLSSPSVTLARQVEHSGQGRVWRELYVATPTTSGVVEGYIDLLVETEEGLIVVDYKTDYLGGDDASPDVEAAIDKAVAYYQYQAATYAVAVEALLGLPVIDCRFLFLAAGGAIERSVDELAQVVGEVRSLLAESP